jgi:hypothetical protein
MQCREGREGGFICPFFCFSLPGMKFLFPKLVVIIFFFSKKFYYKLERALPDKVLATQLQVKLIGRGLSEVSPKRHWV